MKLLGDDDAGAHDAPTPTANKVHVVRSGAAGAEVHVKDSRIEPLRIEYSQTRVMAEAGARLRRRHGVVRTDRSQLSESFKMLRNQVLQRMRVDGYRLLAVTSPRAIEGKSLTAVNLALSIAADFDTAVLLIDADLSGQGLQTWFGLQAEQGLGDHLLDGSAISELLVNPGIARFVVLPAGQRAVRDSAELIATKASQQLIQEMKERYPDRYIVVDLPPLLDTADALAFLPQVETTLVVVEEHTTSMEDIESAAELLAPFNLIGTVMSQRCEDVDATPGRAPWYRRWGRSRPS